MSPTVGLWTQLVAKVAVGVREGMNLILAFTLAHVAMTAIVVRESNPADIANLWNLFSNGWSPTTNQVTGFGIIFGTVALFFAIRWVSSRTSIGYRVLVAGFGTIVSWIPTLSATLAIDFNAFSTSFHRGEQLAPTQAWLEGKSAFTEIYSIHGIGEDILKPALGPALFGTDGDGGFIGPYLVVDNLGRLLALAAFFAFVALVIRGRSAFILVTLFFALTSYNGQYYVKNVALLVVLVLVHQALVRTGTRTRFALYAAAGLLASLSTVLFVDTGIIAVAILACLAIGFAILPERGDGRYAWGSIPTWTRLRYPVTIAAAGVVGQLLLLAMLGPTAYGAFLRMTLSEIPDYQGLVWGTPLPPIQQSSGLVLLLVVAVIALLIAIWVIWSSIRVHRAPRVTPDAVFSLILLLCALVYLRVGLNRPDDGHILMVAPFFLLFAFHLLDRVVHVDAPEAVRWGVLGIGLAVVLTPSIVMPARLAVNGRELAAQVRAVAALRGEPDTRWLTDDQQRVRAYIEREAAPGDGIFVVQPDPMFYYAANIPNPTRFYISWFIDPAPLEQEAIEDLEANPPEFVVWDTGTDAKHTDGNLIDDRIPNIIDWVRENYHDRVQVGNVTILRPDAD